MGDRKAVVKNAGIYQEWIIPNPIKIVQDMTDEMQQEAIECATSALEK